jgi:hypothetical protein
MRHQLLAVGILVVACWGRLAHAQATNASASPQRTPGESSDDGGHEERRALKFLEGVPEETRQRFLAAREKALEDPKLQQLRKTAELANREFFKAIRTKMLEIDPGLAELVRKRSMGFKMRRAWSEEGLNALDDEERQKLLNVAAKVYDHAGVQAAEKKKWNANTTAERKAALDAYRKTLRDTMTKVDPSIAPILDKLDSLQNAAAATPTETSGEQK